MKSKKSKRVHFRIQSWSELSRWLERSREQNWLFRGEADPKYETLKPAVGRVSRSTDSARRVRYLLSDEQHAFSEFKRAARPLIASEPRSEIEWMALAQHHGLPTRLLDWTNSLLVAAFFASEKAETRIGRERSGGVIYCVRGIPEIDERREGNEALFDLKEVKSYHPPHLSRRITVQQSVFTVHPNPTAEFQHPTLERWVLDHRACFEIKRNLNAAGVTYSSLFPDLDGVCRQIAWNYKWGFFQIR